MFLKQVTLFSLYYCNIFKVYENVYIYTLVELYTLFYIRKIEVHKY